MTSVALDKTVDKFDDAPGVGNSSVHYDDGLLLLRRMGRGIS